MRCMNPDCLNLPYALNTHHIIPIKKGGEDDYKNYIVLCRGCHKGQGLHKQDSDNKALELLTYKFFLELHTLGTSSDNENFRETLTNYLKSNA